MVYISGGNELLDPKELFNHVGLEAGMNIADLGCGGAGHFVIPAGQQVGEHGKVYAVDILQTVLQSVASRARLEGVHNVRTIRSDIERYGATRIPAASLDCAFLINVLFQSHDHPAMLKEALRLIKPGGKLLVVDWQANDKSPFGPPSELRVNMDTLTVSAKALGATLVKQFSAGPYHQGRIYVK